MAPEHPYPAQFDDAETAYRWLLAQGYEPHNIGSTGRSIGCTLAVMLPLRLLAKGQATPGAIVSISPWTDLTITNPAADKNEGHDKMLSRDTLELFRGAWLQDPPSTSPTRDQRRQRRPDRPAAHARPLRRVRDPRRRRRRIRAAARGLRSRLRGPPGRAGPGGRGAGRAAGS
ncbi:alpha/beta hydrolase fold domain-containing protein [Saccharothrix luteola]|uniref:alpha/beta hydrolase fold domain-containing protein n=1 Tax=Saccharothrix luteola TaxID=2893018 RepID=UPI001E29AD68|nr:alpha/beta hydrolase fold domain-containing protein [Saccharothrix luteola]MCC8243053.1 alpha/beta hydrolase [Saccharothrix luteola]